MKLEVTKDEAQLLNDAMNDFWHNRMKHSKSNHFKSLTLDLKGKVRRLTNRR